MICRAAFAEHNHVYGSHSHTLENAIYRQFKFLTCQSDLSGLMQETETGGHASTTFTLKAKGQQPVIADLQKHLDAAGVIIMFNCQALRSAIPKHATFMLQHVFDVQVWYMHFVSSCYVAKF